MYLGRNIGLSIPCRQAFCVAKSESGDLSLRACTRCELLRTTGNEKGWKRKRRLEFENDCEADVLKVELS
jgi:hypothetical protein